MSSDDLERRIEAAKSRLQRPGGKPEESPGWRFLSELIAGMLVGGGIGWLLDDGWGTDPWLFIIFLLLGVAAAFWNMFKLASADEIGHTKRDLTRK